MALTEFGTGHALAVQRWSTSLAVEAEKKMYFGKYIGSVITKLTDLEANAGFKITHGLRMKLRGAGVTGDGTLEGNEEALSYYSDYIYIDQLRHAVRSKGKASEQRVPYGMRATAREALATWWAERFDELLFVYLSGARGVDSTLTLPLTFTGFAGNGINTPDAAHNLFAGGLTKATLTATDVLTLSAIDSLVEAAETVDPMIQPIMVGGEKRYVLLIHPYQATDLRTNTNTGQWLDIQKAAAAAQGSGNPIFTGALGMYNGVVIHVHRNVIRFSDLGSGAVKGARALFMGAQAGALAFGNGGGQTVARYSWKEELFDYGNQLGVAAGSIFGVKKTVFNSKDFGVIAFDTAADAH
jgi:N4-gp56 family major capsid protein